MMTALNSEPLKQSAEKIRNWVIHKALPLWAERAQYESGRWVEHLHLDGRPDLLAEVRLRVLARQIYVYAEATRLGWYDGTEIARQTYTQMRKIGYVHRVNASGEPADSRRDLYDHAFFLLACFKVHFFDAENNIIREYFNDDWNVHSGDMGTTAEPGHAMEWIWLLYRYDVSSGRDTKLWREALYANALKNRGYFLNDEENIHGNIRRETRRLWVQTEVIKAHLTMAENRVEGSADMSAAFIDGLFETYLKPDGTWCDQINACGGEIAKTIPVSTFYHIACMAFEAERVSGIRQV